MGTRSLTTVYNGTRVCVSCGGQIDPVESMLTSSSGLCPDCTRDEQAELVRGRMAPPRPRR